MADNIRWLITILSASLILHENYGRDVHQPTTINYSHRYKSAPLSTHLAKKKKKWENVQCFSFNWITTSLMLLWNVSALLTLNHFGKQWTIYFCLLNEGKWEKRVLWSLPSPWNYMVQKTTIIHNAWCISSHMIQGCCFFVFLCVVLLEAHEKEHARSKSSVLLCL